MLATLRGAVQVLGELTGGLLDASLPQTCVACGQWVPGAEGLACPACHAEMTTAMARPYCPRCGRTLPRPSIYADRCAGCRRERYWNVAGVARVGLYEPTLRAVLLDLKYRGQERNAEYLADHLAVAIARRGWLSELDWLVPVPMHWLRRWQRPCDHARLLAESLARRVKVPVLRLVRRVRHSASQTALTTRTARFENVRGCFGHSRWRRLNLTGKTVCIVDNLLSTGATVTEVSKVLRRAGARRIYAAVVARPAAPDDPPAALPVAGPGGH
jgi:ComF family protein